MANGTRPRTIQIDYDLFLLMVHFFLMHDSISDADDRAVRIYDGIEKKFESLERRALYTVYKTSHSFEEREKARLEYLDMMGIPEDFRWVSGTDPSLI